MRLVSANIVRLDECPPVLRVTLTVSFNTPRLTSILNDCSYGQWRCGELAVRELTYTSSCITIRELELLESQPVSGMV